MKTSKLHARLKTEAETKALAKAAEMTAYDPEALRRHLQNDPKKLALLAKAEKATFNPSALTAPERNALEAIVLTTGRPVFLIENDSVDFDGADGGEWPARLRPREARINELLKSVGRVEISTGTDPFGADRRDQMLGTCFVIGDHLVLTNHHVAIEFCHPDGSLRPGITASVDFVEEFRRDTDKEFRVAGVVALDPDLDFAVLEIERTGAFPRPLRLAANAEEASVSDLSAPASHPHVFIVGYPAFDSRNDPGVQMEIFGGVFEVKRLAPGRLRRSRSDSEGIVQLEGDYSSLGGNSGSAVFNLETGTVISLHNSGSYLVGNYSIPIWRIIERARILMQGPIESLRERRGTISPNLRTIPDWPSPPIDWPPFPLPFPWPPRPPFPWPPRNPFPWPPHPSPHPWQPGAEAWTYTPVTEGISEDTASEVCSPAGREGLKHNNRTNGRVSREHVLNRTEAMLFCRFGLVHLRPNAPLPISPDDRADLRGPINGAWFDDVRCSITRDELRAAGTLSALVTVIYNACALRI